MRGIKIGWALTMLFALLCAGSLGQAQDHAIGNPEPFGFKMGMSKNQVIALVGKSAIQDQDNDSLTLTTAPKPYPDCDGYVVFFSPEKGLLKVVATTSTIKVNDEGDQLKDEFSKLSGILRAKYGDPGHTFDFIRNNDEADEKYWMMSLLDKERFLAMDWNYGTGEGKDGDTIGTGIYIKAVALSLNTGYVTIGYEFPGWNAYVDSKKAQANSSF
jgi:hypothetical protein